MRQIPDKAAPTWHLFRSKRSQSQNIRAKKISSLKAKIFLKTCIPKANKTVKVHHDLVAKILLKPVPIK
jgi:hypothetical protein